MPATAPTPARPLGRLDVVGLGVNCVIGSGIFLLPGPVASRVGPAAIVAVGGAGVLAFVIALCFAEAGSRFSGTGGAYLYAREAFGPAVGFTVGWVSTLAGIVAWGALVNAFAVALGHFFPAVARHPLQPLVVAGFVAALAWINLRGAKPGARLSNLFSASKLLTLAAFVAAGALFVDPAHLRPFAPHGWAPLPAAILLMLYAFVGFENLVVPAGEMAAPQRSVPAAILSIMGLVSALYAGVLWVTAGTLGSAAAGAGDAVADSARSFLGPAGGALVAAGVVISIVGVNAASALILPRRLSALAERGDLPALFGRLHPSFGTPWVAIAVVFTLTGAVAMSGSFEELAALAVVGRLLQYLPTCLAVLVLRRRRQAPAAAFRIPLGPTVPLVALALGLALLAQANAYQLAAGGVAILAGLPVYLWRRRRLAAPVANGSPAP